MPKIRLVPTFRNKLRACTGFNLLTVEKEKTMEHKTTLEHYSKYALLAKISGFKFKDTVLGRPRIQMEKLFSVDPNLNNIPLHEWDRLGSSLLMGQSVSMAERVCILKHLAIFQFLGAIAVFSPEIKPESNLEV